MDLSQYYSDYVFLFLNHRLFFLLLVKSNFFFPVHLFAFFSLFKHNNNVNTATLFSKYSFLFIPVLLKIYMGHRSTPCSCYRLQTQEHRVAKYHLWI